MKRRVISVEGTIAGRIVPHVRVGRERWTPRAKRYRADQDRIEEHAKRAFAAAGQSQAGRPWFLYVAAYFNPAKRTGALPLNCGDIDNITKSIADALQRAKVTPDDAWLYLLRAEKFEADAEGERVFWRVTWEAEGPC